MARRDPVLVVMRTTRVRLSNGRVVTLLPGCKSLETSERIKSALGTKERLKDLQAGGRLVEDTPPW